MKKNYCSPKRREVIVNSLEETPQQAFQRTITF